MELKRRDFIGLLLAGLAAAAAAAAGLLRRAGGSRVLRAEKPGAYPGRVRPLDEAKVRRSGGWAG